MVKRHSVVCSCGQELPRPIPKVCPACKSEISRIEYSRSPVWLPVVLVVLMFGILLGLILLLGKFN